MTHSYIMNKWSTVAQLEIILTLTDCESGVFFIFCCSMLILLNCFDFFCDDVVRKIECKKDDKDQETIQSSTTPDPGYHMGK